MNGSYIIGQEWVPGSIVFDRVRGRKPLSLCPDARAVIKKAAALLQGTLEKGKNPVYGVNTGFGDLCNVQITPSQINLLQENLILSHAAGMGDPVPLEIARLILYLKIQNISLGFSGVRPVLIDRLIEMYNHDMIPVMFELGSLGASGDLAPLAHLSLPLLGKGEVYLKGQRMPTQEAMQTLKLSPITLAAKEGLALLNGTQFSTAYTLWSHQNGKQLLMLANICAALSIEAFRCRLTPFDHRLHAVRPHPGQVWVAEAIRGLLHQSPLHNYDSPNIQDPYAFRCIPQVHGATFDALAYIQGVLDIEVNAVTDNPTVFPEDEEVLSGGNFHAQPIALAADHMAIALAELGSISERRTFQLLSGKRGLPPFLTPEPGLNSGFMIPQYTAAAIVSQNKQLASPASIDSIVSSNGQEDHVSMAANASTKLHRIVENVYRILAIEWMTAAQATTFHQPDTISPQLEKWLTSYREQVPFLKNDVYLHPLMQITVSFLKELIPMD